MGFFSFHTTDTKAVIWNTYQDMYPTKIIYMIDNKGNQWEEPSYEGYGKFGGKDFHELVAEMNGFGSDREKGIDIYFESERKPELYKDFIFPNLVTKPNMKWRNTRPKDHDGQGFWIGRT